MFDDWKKAWEQAVSNFERELAHEDGNLSPGQRATTMRRDLAAAQKALDRLQLDLTQTRKEVAAEEEAIQTCERRAAMAERIGDDETVRIAQEFGRRHNDRAGILRRKADVLQEELAMRMEELGQMEQQAAAEFAETEKLEQNRLQQDVDFRKLDRERREKEAEARLEELKKRMT